jgi:hypothetical protein
MTGKGSGIFGVLKTLGDGRCGTRREGGLLVGKKLFFQGKTRTGESPSGSDL